MISLLERALVLNILDLSMDLDWLRYIFVVWVGSMIYLLVLKGCSEVSEFLEEIVGLCREDTRIILDACKERVQ